MLTMLTVRLYIIAALALQALMALLTHTLASFPGPDQLFIVCNVWSCGVKLGVQ